MIVSVSKDEVKITELSQVNQGDHKVNLCTFILPECFSGLSVTAVFNGIPVPVTSNRCYIPSLENGNCVLGVYAYKEAEGKIILMYSPKPTVFYVEKGSFTTDVNTEELPKVFDYETYCNMLKDFWEQVINENTLASYDENAKYNQYYSAQTVNEIADDMNGKKVPLPTQENTINYGEQGQVLKSNGDGSTYWDSIANRLPTGENTFEKIDLPLYKVNATYYLTEDGSIGKKEATNCSPIAKCPRYLGFRIGDSETRIYLYIGTLDENGDFVFNKEYHIKTSTEGEINYLRDTDNRFIETDGEQYFYYKIAKGDKVTFVGSDTFPQGESDIIATVPNFVSNDGELHIESGNYYSIVLPTGCFYAVLNKGNFADYENRSFNVSYQTGVNVNGEAVIQVDRGASFGFIPENVGAALIRVPDECNINDLYIYTDKAVKSNADSGRRRKAKELGEKIIKDFSFESQKEIFWNDSTRPMAVGRGFYGVPYSSRWVNSHYVGFEVTPETALNALNDPYSIAYDGGFVAENERAESVSGHTEISKDGGTGYGLVCSAFTNLICGNPYPQTNRGYTFDSNFVLEDTVDMNSGEVLANKGLSHCVFVDEIYDEGYSLYEAVDPCVAKTTHTCPEDKTTYAASKVRTSYLDNYVYSVVNKDTSGYEKLASLLNFDNIEVAKGSVRPWRGNKAVYGSWDIRGTSNDGFEGSGIGVTLHNGVTSFELTTPSGNFVGIMVGMEDGREIHYVDITEYVTENGTYTLDAKDGSAPEYFRFYNHDTVQLAFDSEGKAVFKNCSDDSVANDVEYVYVKVKGYGGEFGNDNSEGAMVIAKGKCYPDLALDTSRIVDVRAAIISDITTDSTLTESWGKYSCATSPVVISDYKKGLYTTEEITVPYEYTVATGYINENLNGEVTNTTKPKYKYTETFFSQEDFVSCTFSIPSGITCYIHYYDEDKNFVIKAKMIDGSVLNNLKHPYMRVGAYTSATELTEEDFRSLFDIKQKSTVLVPKKSELHSLNVVTFGDSITYYDSHNFGSAHIESGTIAIGYQTHIREKLGCNVDNQGVSGYNLPEILGVIKGYDFTNTDIVTITSGANDYNDITSGTETLGSIAPIGSTFDETSFYGALQSAIEYILAQNMNIKIILITPIKGWFPIGILPEDYANAIKEVGKLYSLPVCDWYNESGINDITKSIYIGDITSSGKYLHPTNAGYKRMADILTPIMQSY